ncbi:hypothetical protein MVEN_02388100 [Mycena venus]|uniref:Uncharacterized protein n=1 Tax=Mycena venus TaxID=2733690 RepID=A0A8H7CES2_9AGAR|nr:hypothetical protein MVEN_02388100 [Mycena venus]
MSSPDFASNSSNPPQSAEVSMSAAALGMILEAQQRVMHEALARRDQMERNGFSVRCPRGTRAGKPRRRKKSGRKVDPEVPNKDADAEVFGGLVHERDGEEVGVQHNVSTAPLAAGAASSAILFDILGKISGAFLATEPRPRRRHDLPLRVRLRLRPRFTRRGSFVLTAALLFSLGGPLVSSLPNKACYGRIFPGVLSNQHLIQTHDISEPAEEDTAGMLDAESQSHQEIFYRSQRRDLKNQGTQ